MRAASSYKWTRAESNRRLNRFAFVVLSARSLLWLLVPSPEDRRLYTEPCSSRLLPSLSQGHLMCTPQAYQDQPRGVRSELRSDGVRAVVGSYVGAVLTGQRPAHIQRQVTDPSIPVAPVLIGRGIPHNVCVHRASWRPGMFCRLAQVGSCSAIECEASQSHSGCPGTSRRSSMFRCLAHGTQVVCTQPVVW